MSQATSDRQIAAIVLVVLGALFVLPLLFMGFGLLGMGPFTGGMWDGHMWDGGMWGLSGGPGIFVVIAAIFRLLFLVALLVGAYLVYRHLTRSGPSDGDRALEELRLAYARGDLTDEEFEARREKLESR